MFINNQYDRRGFNNEGKHRNGTYYDTEGYEISGYDRRGFDRNGKHRNGTVFDNDGYDVEGHDKYGFNKNEIHFNGTRQNNDGYTKKQLENKSREQQNRIQTNESIKLFGGSLVNGKYISNPISNNYDTFIRVVENLGDINTYLLYMEHFDLLSQLIEKNGKGKDFKSFFDELVKIIGQNTILYPEKANYYNKFFNAFVIGKESDDVLLYNALNYVYEIIYLSEN